MSMPLSGVWQPGFKKLPSCSSFFVKSSLFTCTVWLRKLICETYGVSDAKAWAMEQVRLMNEAEKRMSPNLPLNCAPLQILSWISSDVLTAVTFSSSIKSSFEDSKRFRENGAVHGYGWHPHCFRHIPRKWKRADNHDPHWRKDDRKILQEARQFSPELPKSTDTANRQTPSACFVHPRSFIPFIPCVSVQPSHS